MTSTKPGQNPVMIAENGRATAAILIPTDAPESTRYAARELRHYLELITAALFDIVSQPGSGPLIALGRAAEELGIQTGIELGEDGFSISRKGSHLGIIGGCRGIIYGVYELLERLGCRFFTPTCEVIPNRTELAMPDLQTTQVPRLEYRYHNYVGFTGHPRFAVKSRINGPVPIKEQFGGHLSYVWFVHTFEHNLIHPDEYFDEHPEYFSMVDGRRLRERSQLCLTNPDVLKIVTDKVKAALREHPECRLISVSQNDWYNPCQCPECSRIDTAEGSHAGSLIRFVNQVAEAIEPEFPRIIIDTLAYQYSRPAPKTIRPRHNVCVRLCSIEACFAHPLDSCSDQTRKIQRPDGSTTGFIDDLQDWAKVCDRLHIWDYTTCFAHYPMPYPNWNVLQPNMQAFVRNHVRGVFEQANGAQGGGVDLNELRAYLIGKLLWDADCDLESHLMDFLTGFYGAAAPFIRRYIKTLTDKVEQDQIHLGFNDSCDRAHLTEEMLDRYDELFAQALAAVADDPIRQMRVARAQLAVRWVRMKNRAMLRHEIDPAEVNRFFTDWRAHGLTRIDEWVSAETTHRALLAGLWRGTEFLENWWEEGPEEL